LTVIRRNGGWEEGKVGGTMRHINKRLGWLAMITAIAALLGSLIGHLFGVKPWKVAK